MQVQLSLVDDLSSALESIIGTLGEFENNVSSVNDALNGIDSSSLNEVDNAANSASGSLNETGDSARDAGEGVKEASDSTDFLGAALSGLVALGVASWFEEITNAAGEYSDAWLAFGNIVDSSADNVAGIRDEWSGSIQEVRDVTHRGVMDVMKSFAGLDLAGIHSKGVMEQSTKAIQGMGFNMEALGRGSMQTVQAGFERIVMSGNLSARTLKNVGLSMEDLERITGKSSEQIQEEFKNMSAEERAMFLSDAMLKSGAEEGNKDYEKSWARVNDEVNRAWGYLNRIIGDMVLPIVIPAIETLTGLLRGLADNMDDMNPILKTIVGSLIMVAGFGVALVPLVTTAKLLFNTFSDVKGAIGGALEKLGILNKTPCKPKTCKTTGTTTGTPSTTSLLPSTILSMLGLSSSAGGVASMGAGTFALGGLISGAIGAAAGFAGGYGMQSIGQRLGLGQGQIDMANVMGLIPGLGPALLGGQTAAGRQTTPTEMLLAWIPGLNTYIGFWETMWDMLPDNVTDALNPIGDGLENIQESVTRAWDYIREQTQKIWNTIKRTITTLINNIKSTVSVVFTPLK